jgi:hypothetical protein
MKNWVVGLLMVCMLGACSVASFADDKNAEGVIFSEDFKDTAAAVKKLNLDVNEWEVTNGAVQSKRALNGVARFFFGETGWKDYNIELKVKQLNADPKDHHFSIFVRCANDANLRLYCPGDVIKYIEAANGKAVRHEVLGKLPKPMELGEKSPWSTFKVSLIGSTASVYVDGKLIGKIENLAPSEGRIMLFTYNVNVMFSDIKVTSAK